MKTFIAVLMLSFSIVAWVKNNQLVRQSKSSLVWKTWQKIEEEFSGYDLEKPYFTFPSKGDFYYDLGDGSAYYHAGMVVLPYDYINFDDDNIMSVLAHEIGHAIFNGTKTQIISETLKLLIMLIQYVKIGSSNPVRKLSWPVNNTSTDGGSTQVMITYQGHTKIWIPSLLILDMLKRPFAEKSKSCNKARQNFNILVKNITIAKNKDSSQVSAISQGETFSLEKRTTFLGEMREYVSREKWDITSTCQRASNYRQIEISDKIKLFNHSQNPLIFFLN